MLELSLVFRATHSFSYMFVKAIHVAKVLDFIHLWKRCIKFLTILLAPSLLPKELPHIMNSHIWFGTDFSPDPLPDTALTFISAWVRHQLVTHLCFISGLMMRLTAQIPADVTTHLTAAVWWDKVQHKHTEHLCLLFFVFQEKQYVGFATLPNQVHRKSVKKGFDFTLMVAGAFQAESCLFTLSCLFNRHTKLKPI